MLHWTRYLPRHNTCCLQPIVFLIFSQEAVDMVRIEGKYQHERNENLDAYFRAIGVPYIARKMMEMTSPLLEVVGEENKWTLRSITMFRTHEVVFTIGEEYEEAMPSGDVLKCRTTRDGDSFVTVSEAPSGAQVKRTYSFSEDGVLLTMIHEESGEIAKRHFKRVQFAE